MSRSKHLAPLALLAASGCSLLGLFDAPPGSMDECFGDGQCPSNECRAGTCGVEGYCVYVRQDADGDGFSPAMCPDMGLTGPEPQDCDDTAAVVAPGQSELCNGRDDDCNGTDDDGAPCGEALVSIAVGGYPHARPRDDRAFVCGVTVSGNVYCTGDNHCGQLGAGVGNTSQCWTDRVPEYVEMPDSRSDRVMQVLGVSGAVEVAAGATSACARTDAGEVWCWGNNISGMLGDGESSAGQTVPVRVDVPPTSEIVCGTNHCCARLESGEVSCWGSDIGWILGGSGLEAPPTLVPALSGATAIVAASELTCGVVADDVVCLGFGTPPSLTGPADQIEVAVAGDALACGRVAGRVTCRGGVMISAVLRLEDMPPYVDVAVAFAQIDSGPEFPVVCAIQGAGRTLSCLSVSDEPMAAWAPYGVPAISGVLDVSAASVGGRLCALHDEGRAVSCVDLGDPGTFLPTGIP